MMLFPYLCDSYLLNMTFNSDILLPDKSGDLYKNCSLHGITAVICIFFIYLTVVIATYLRFCMKKRRNITKRKIKVDRGITISSDTSVQNSEREKKLKNFRRKKSKQESFIQDTFFKTFHHHKSVWLVSFVVTISVCFQLAETVTQMGQSGSFSCEDQSINSTLGDTTLYAESRAKPSSSVLFYTHIAAISSSCLLIMCISCFMFLFREVECQKDQAKVLCVHIVFFFLLFLVACSKLYVHVMFAKLSIHHVKVLVDTVICTGSIILDFLYGHMIFVHRHGKKGDSHEHLSNVKYLQNHCSLPSRLTFFWFTSILQLGYIQPLEDTDLGELPPEESTQYHLARFQRIYKREQKKQEKSDVSLWKCLFKTLWSSLLVGGAFRLAADLTGFVAPLGIRSIVEYAEGNFTLTTNSCQNMTITELTSNGYIMALIVLLSGFLQSTFSQCSTFLVNSEGIHIKVALQAMIYKKLLKLSPSSISKPHGNNDNVQDETQNSSSTGFDSGSICNIMSEDTNNIMMFFWMGHFIWAIPLKLGILMALLYLQLGYSALLGAAVCIVIMIPLQFLIGKHMSTNSKELMERCDDRLRSISEILHGMKLLKLHGWEHTFCDKVLSLRQKELQSLDKDLLYRSIMTFLTHISSVLVTVITFGLYGLIETEKLEPPKVFAGLALFNQLTVPLFIFPITVPVIIDALVSAKRVREFLSLPETASISTMINNDYCNPKKNFSSEESVYSVAKQTADNKSDLSTQNEVYKFNIKELQVSTDSVFELENIEEDDEDMLDKSVDEISAKQSEVPLQTPEFVVSVTNATFSWESASRHTKMRPERTTSFQLYGMQRVFLNVPLEKLTVIVGPIGSGKSSLIAAILGEMRKIGGKVSWARNSSIAYAAQKPWMLNATVRDNILFGKPFQPQRYKKVISACALQPDIDILPNQDFTEIGEKGINLSGGQKQRIAIARAFYSQANVVILDDPLSALDVEVAHHVLDAGIRKFLLKNKRTVILVTHHLPVLHHAHHIVAMEKGNIRIQGSLKEIQDADPSLYAEWKEMISKKEAELQKHMETKTAKERWSLLKLVSKIGLQLKNRRWVNDNVDKPRLEPFRRGAASFSHYKNLSHDIFFPGDECHEELLTPLLRRRTISKGSKGSSTSVSSNRHGALRRISSLQPDPGSISHSPMLRSKIQRLQSLPANEGKVARTSFRMRIRSGHSDCQGRSQVSFIKRLFNTSRQLTDSVGSSAPEQEAVPTSRLPSSVSGVSDPDTIEEAIAEAEDPLLTKDSSLDEREYGTIPLRVYLLYLSSCGKFISGAYLLTAIGYEVMRVYTNFWLSEWSDMVLLYKDDNVQYENVMSYYYNVYVILSVITVAVSFSSNLLGKYAGANSRESLHYKMLNCIVRCPIRFFDSTPLGRLLNRFASDTAVVDRKLCISMQRFLQFVFLCLSAIAVNAIVNPWFLIAAVPIVGIYYYIQRYYRFSSRELQRIQAISRGPIYSHFQESLQGLSIIRAHEENKRFTSQMLKKLDANNIADMFINVGNRWLSISLDHLGSVIVFIATLASLISCQVYSDVVTPSMVGLAINYTLLVPVYLNWVVKFLAEVEMFMNSVDRIDNYSNLEIEDYGESCQNVPSTWPSKGKIEFTKASIQYGPDRPAILKNLNLSIPGSQKVGICGRSGCGKSSMLMALFRMCDISSGKILIDGVDVKTVPLLQLRSSLSIIPQENILFSGTMRFNLDPKNQCTDDQIWDALHMCQMKENIQELPGQLYSEVQNGGVAFSAGQKQLLALARAIIHKSKVVVMDEATSSVDIATERTLLAVVKNAFKDSTVLTVAHRLNTIADGDRVLVLENGSIVEDGNPGKLLRKPLSQFASMLRNAGEQNILS